MTSEPITVAPPRVFTACWNCLKVAAHDCPHRDQQQYPLVTRQQVRDR